MSGNDPKATYRSSDDDQGLETSKLPKYGANESGDESSVKVEEVYAFEESRKLGITSSVFLIINKMIGTGIFSTPSGIFKSTGSVGVSLFLWLIGGILTFCGLSVFLEFGLRLPFSGGEKNYLERIYRHPKYLATSVLLSQMVLLGFSSGNSLAFGRYVLFAAGEESPGDWTARGIAIACITFACVLHSTFPKWGMRLFNILGIFKVVVLVFIVFSGFAALAGHVKLPEDQKPNNFKDAFHKHDFGGGVYNYATALLRIVYSYKGWENLNYVLGEVKRPQRTLSIATPLAVGGCTVLYVLANVAYFAAIPLDQLKNSGVIVSGLFFRNVFGNSAGTQALPVMVALSNLGNVLAVSFAHSRVNQEFAKEGILPFSRFFASNKPFNAPAASLFLHWIVTVIVLVAPPAGEAYEFIVDLYTYPGAWINGFVGLGLLWIHFDQWRKERAGTAEYGGEDYYGAETTPPAAVHGKPLKWIPNGWKSPHILTVIYILANAFLAIVPFIPPDEETTGYPYYVFPIVGVGVLILGAAYWAVWAKLKPKLGGYKVVAERVVLEDGAEVVRYRKVKTH